MPIRIIAGVMTILFLWGCSKPAQQKAPEANKNNAEWEKFFTVSEDEKYVLLAVKHSISPTVAKELVIEYSNRHDMVSIHQNKVNIKTPPSSPPSTEYLKTITELSQKTGIKPDTIASIIIDAKLVDKFDAIKQ